MFLSDEITDILVLNEPECKTEQDCANLLLFIREIIFETIRDYMYQEYPKVRSFRSKLFDEKILFYVKYMNNILNVAKVEAESNLYSFNPLEEEIETVKKILK